jgi:hypothetical protein
MNHIETSWVVGVALIVVLVMITASGRGTHHKPASAPAAAQTQHK